MLVTVIRDSYERRKIEGKLEFATRILLNMSIPHRELRRTTIFRKASRNQYQE